MQFQYYPRPELPSLSWALALNKQAQIVEVHHGSGVETREHCFFEGAWDGKFEEYGFDACSFFVGTGCKIVEDGGGQKLLIVTPNHVLEKVLVYRSKDTLYASNSLAFLLALSNQELDSDYTQYEADFSSILEGINVYTKRIPLRTGYCEQYFYSNLEVTTLLKLTIKPKSSIIEFVDYYDYHKRIYSMMERLAKNSSHCDRITQYGLVTTISSGYDASACAALAKVIGCDAVVSFNSPEKYETDSGAEIADSLGYSNMIHHSALEYLSNTDLVEAEFCASGELGTGIIFEAFKKEFASSLVFFGVRGDRIWGNQCDDVNNEFRFAGEIFAGISFTENRLKVGYFMCPLPLFGAEQWQSIDTISKSEEMQHYTIGGNYDRPIPRRILEENGVDRLLFGQKKVGAGINYRYDSRKRLKQRMSRKSYESFIKYVALNKRKPQLKQWWRFLLENRYIYI